jgi:hypothetical protein
VANVRNANTFYIDTQRSTAADDLVVKNIKVTDVIVTVSAAGGQVILSDVSTTNVKLSLKVATDEETKHFKFHASPILFPNGISATTLTNAVVTCVIQESRS